MTFSTVDCFTLFLFSAVASKPPEFDRTPTNKTVNAQDVITLLCRSKPPRIVPTLQDWRKDGKPLLAEDIANGRIVSNAGQLLIKSATREDSGNYTCTLVNSAGNITSNRSVVIVKGNRFLLTEFLSCFMAFHFYGKTVLTEQQQRQRQLLFHPRAILQYNYKLKTKMIGVPATRKNVRVKNARKPVKGNTCLG